MRVDPTPYGPRARRGRRWAVEFWHGEEHGFRQFWTRRGAARWASRRQGVFDAQMLAAREAREGGLG